MVLTCFHDHPLFLNIFRSDPRLLIRTPFKVDQIYKKGDCASREFRPKILDLFTGLFGGDSGDFGPRLAKTINLC
jgi:hypothetical protein